MNPLGWFHKRARAPLTGDSMFAVRMAAAESQRSRIPQMAAALSYRTLFGIIPVLVIGLLGANRFMSHEQRADVIERAVAFTGLGNITVNTKTLPSSARREVERGDGAGSASTLPGTAETDSDYEQAGPPIPKGHGISEVISALVSNASTSRGSKGSKALSAIGLVGLVTLIYAAVSMLVEIERAFNQIFRVPRGRSWWRRTINYWTLLTLGGIGLAGTLIVGAWFEIKAKELVAANGFGESSGPIVLHLVGYATTVVISTALLTMVYATVPNTRVKPLAALVGGFIAALLWEAGKWGFGQYVAYSSGYAKLYGSLALVPLFMLWVYYTWLIVLFGLLVVYQFQYGRLKTRPQPLSELGPTIVDPTAGLLVMTAMARAMVAGTPQSIKTLTQNTGLGEGVVSLVVSRFAERGLLLRVERDGEGDALYTLARTPGSIRVGEVLALGFELAGGPESNPVVERMRKAQVNAAGSETLADIAGTPGDGQLRPATPAAPSADKPVLVAQAARP